MSTLTTTATFPSTSTTFTLSSPVAKKPLKLRNLTTGESTIDNLHKSYTKQNTKSHGCNENRCLGSLLNPVPVEHKVRSVSETLDQASDFINNYYASIKRTDSPAHKNRLAEIEEQIRTTETYYLKETELIYGAKQAWRNAPRCIGRIQWSKLQVFDARFTTNANEMFEALCNHIKYSTNKGSLRSAITIFPQRVKSTKNDWRIWNSQLIGYAGYRDPQTGKVTGDPINVDFTEICQKLGWQGKGTKFDVLPLVLQAGGESPQVFPLPEDLVMRVKIKHPKYPWFEELGLEWYALPAVANMMLDVGGLQFTAAPFSGWYMVTEIGTRDLGDVNRYNMLEEVALKMGLNTTSNMSLWKDQAVVEMNIAVLDSFQQAGVTIVDHHTACDTFMTHLANEQRLRGGCPADWVWLVPPTAGSTTQVYHQEMVLYHLLPNYEYQDPVWKHFDWTAWERKQADDARDALTKRKASLIAANAAASNITAGLRQAVGTLISPTKTLATATNGSNGLELTPRRLRFKEIARAVKFTSKLFGKALSRRIKATILYATETGKSERFANKLAQTFSCAFNVHLMCMGDYDMTCLEHEALLLIVTSTFGNGDPPENGELFAKHLAAVKITGDTSPDIDSINSVSTNPFFQMLSEDHKDGLTERDDYDASGNLRRGGAASSSGGGGAGGDSAISSSSSILTNSSKDWGSLNRADTVTSLGGRSQKDKQEEQTNIRPLSNVRFSVFALGSTAYPHFCAFGRYVDQTLGDLGAERIHGCACGDELSGQEKAFNEWSNEVFKVACDVFCLTDQIGPIEERPEVVWSPLDVKFMPIELVDDDNQTTNSRGGDLNDGDKTPTTTKQRSNTTVGEKDTIGVLTSKKTIVRNLMNITNKRIIPFTVKKRTNLHKFIPEENLQTLCIDMESELISNNQLDLVNGNSINTKQQISNISHSNSLTGGPASKQTGPVSFEPGDHIAIYPTNKLEMIDKLLTRMREDLAREPNASALGTPSSALMLRKRQALDFDQVYTILVKRENMDLTPATTMATAPSPRDPLGKENWIQHDRLPITSIREALTRYLDITNPPNQEFLLILSRLATDQDERKKLQQMGKNFTIYEAWKNRKIPTLLSVLEEFKSVIFEPALLTQIPQIKPRFYSVSGISVNLTLGVVRFKTATGELREGLCSNYLNTVAIDPKTFIYGYVRSAPAFHMPADKRVPLILISAGTGIAPFRSFWQKRYLDMYRNTSYQRQQQQANSREAFGKMEMYFGCRNSNYILYRDELNDMYQSGVLTSINIAFSRPIDRDVQDTRKQVNNGQTQVVTSTSENLVENIRQARKKVYVQDKLLENREDIYKLIMIEGAHVYVCGDVAMADGVYKTLANICSSSARKIAAAEAVNRLSSDLMVDASSSPPNLSASGNESPATTTTILNTMKSLSTTDDGETIMMNLRNLNRYHEDIFGAKGQIA